MICPWVASRLVGRTFPLVLIALRLADRVLLVQRLVLPLQLLQKVGDARRIPLPLSREHARSVLPAPARLLSATGVLLLGVRYRVPPCAHVLPRVTRPLTRRQGCTGLLELDVSSRRNG